MDKTKNSGKILTFSKALKYGIGIFGIQAFIGYINTFQSQFYTSVFKADLMVCAVIILVAKIISCLADPIIGNIIDRSHFKSGKMKPFIFMSSFPLAILTTLMFVKINFANNTVMYIYITVTTVLWNISMTFADIPSQGQLALLSPNSEERSVAAGISNTMKSVALVLPNLIVPVVCVLTKSEGGKIYAKEYFISALVLIVVGVICYTVMLTGTKEVVESQSNRMTIKDMLLELKNNKMLLLVFASLLLGFGRNMAVNIGVQAAAVVFDTVKVGPITLSGENLPIVLGIGSGATSMLSIMCVPMLSKKWGDKKTFIILGVYGLIISTIAYLLFVFDIGGLKTQHTFWFVFICQFFIGLMFGTHGYTPLVMVADIVDYQEMKTGKRTEGIQYAVLSLGMKLANALSVAVSVFIVGASGYTGSVTYADSVANPAMANTIMSAYWLIPGICCLLACVPIFFYKIDDKTKKEIKAFKEAQVAAMQNETVAVEEK